MIMHFKDTDIKLNPREVKSAKKAISQFLAHIKELTENELAPTYYYTLLIMMHIMSQELLNDFDEETLASIFNRLGAKDESNKKSDN